MTNNEKVLEKNINEPSYHKLHNSCSSLSFYILYQCRSVLPKFPEISEKESTDNQHETGDDNSSGVHSVTCYYTVQLTMVQRNLISVDWDGCHVYTP